MELEALVISGALNFGAALLHIGVIIGGASWYRFFGAGETMATMAENGSIKPTLITLFIAGILFTWGLIAWSGAGLIPELPLLKMSLIGIISVYLLRGFVGLFAPYISDHPQIQQNSKSFWFVSSAVCLIFGAVHLQGLVSNWANM